MRRIQFFFLSFATSIVLLHSIIPHKHHSEITLSEDLQQHQSVDKLIDYVALAFHLDPGQGHLEEFLTTSTDLASDNHFTLSFPIGWEPLNGIFNQINQPTQYAEQPMAAPREVYGEAIGLRGPPTQS